MFWQFFYNCVVVPLGWLGFRIAGLLNPKVSRGIRGRKGLFGDLEAQVRTLDPASKRIWFHSSSLGEFEQAKPIIAELKRRHPGIKIIVSFFSPSGYEHSKNYKFADVIAYIPFDSHRNASRFLRLIRPTALVMLRYDVWPNHLWAAQRNNVPTFIASATLRSKTARSVPVIHQFFKMLYNSVDYILTVSPEDRRIFESLHLQHPVLEVIGDTRYDQVLQRCAESKSRPLLAPGIISGKRVFVIGSSWSDDEQRLLPACTQLIAHDPDMLVIIVPHEPTVEHLEQLETQLNGTATFIRFSAINDYRGEQFIIVDSVGLLMPLYQYATVAYVGGSFGGGVHNVLEPAVYHVPILFGPHHGNSQEAVRLEQQGAAFSVNDTEEIVLSLRQLFEHETLRTQAGEKAQSLVAASAGATERFLSYLEKVL